MLSAWRSKAPSCMRLFSTSSRCEKSVRIGGASGFWGDTPTAAHQLIHGGGKVDYLMFDYLSEVTMSLLTAAMQKRPELGYAPDFVSQGIGPHLNEIKRQGIRVVTNAGGINTSACAAALEAACKKAGVDLKVATVQGDDLMPMREKLMEEGKVQEMDTGAPLPMLVHSMTAYYGAGPIVNALEMGADIVVTGRTADSALALAPCMHELGWKSGDLDKLAAGSLAGHLIECGGQATGGLFTDWQSVPAYENLGFPVAEVQDDGDVLISKPPNTGGIVSRLGVAEQMLYEVGDPRNYLLPDVNCDFANVVMREEGDVVRVSGAKGKPATDTYKVSATYMDGFKATAVCVVAGGDAVGKARKTADAILKRSRAIIKKMGMEDFTRVHISPIGAEDSYGKNAVDRRVRETALWMSLRHPEKKALDVWSREIASAGTGMAPGLAMLVGGRPKANPCLRLFSFLHPKSALPATVKLGDKSEKYEWSQSGAASKSSSSGNEIAAAPNQGGRRCRLEEVAVARSGDKGDSCNIGVIARDPKYLPHLARELTADKVADYFSAVCEGPVERYSVPGVGGMNFLLKNALDGGGIASTRFDPLGKSFAQMLLDMEVEGMPE